MSENHVIFTSVFLFAGLVFAGAIALLVWLFVKKLITVKDLEGTEWRIDKVEFEPSGFCATLTSGGLKLSYRRFVDCRSEEVLTEIKVSLKKAWGIVVVDIKGDDVIRACAANMNYTPPSCPWAYDLKTEVEKVVNEYFKRQSPIGLSASSQ